MDRAVRGGARTTRERPAFVLSQDVDVADVGPARLYATAHGIYETFLNGVRVGDVELAPGFTSYDVNLHVQTYDVTGLIRSGANRWEVVLSDGWYRGEQGSSRSPTTTAISLAFLGQLHVGDATFGTGAGWRSSTGPVTAADLMAGQVVDLRLAADDGHPVRVVDHDLTRLTSSPAPPTRRVEELRPLSVTRPAPDRMVVDVGQNINGWIRLARPRPRGNHAHAHPWRGAEPDRGRDPGPPGRSGLHERRHPPRRPDRPGHLRRAGGRRLRAPTHHPRVPVRPNRGPPGPADSRRRDRRRGPHRPPPDGWFRCSDDGSTGSTRSPTGASGTTPARSRRTVRNASGPAGPGTTRSSSPRRRSCTTWPASP